MRSRGVLGVVSLLVAAVAALPATSGAAVTTIGPQTLSIGTENTMSTGTFIQFSGTGPAAQYTSPLEGTVVTWRVASGSSAPVSLRILRPAGGGKFTAVGTSAPEMADAGQLDTFATSLPIKAGDVIGVVNENQAILFTGGVQGASSEVFAPGLADGGPAAEPKEVAGSGGGKELELQINADVQPAVSTGGGGSSGGSGGAGNGGGGNIGASQPVAPTLASLKLVPGAFTAASSGGSIGGRHNRGTTVSYTDSQAATTTFVVLQKRPGRRGRAGTCVAPAHAPHGRPCTRLVTIGSFTHADNSGSDAFHFSGRVAGRTLKPGSYEIRAVARDAAGLASRQLAGSFRVKR